MESPARLDMTNATVSKITTGNNDRTMTLR